MNWKRTWINNKQRPLSVFVVAISTCCLAVAFAAQAYNREGNLPDPDPTKVVAVAPGPVHKSAAQSNQQRERIKTEVVTILPDGFEPAEITRRHGRFFLAVDNRSGLEQVSLRLDKETGNRLRDVRVNRADLDWADVVNLTPGTYLLTEANNPEWVCKIIITGN